MCKQCSNIVVQAIVSLKSTSPIDARALANRSGLLFKLGSLALYLSKLDS